MRSNLPVTDHEYVLADGKTIVSTTDLKGNITYANPYFVEVSGFSEQELIGAPQNILRHPDMPAGAYADLWTTIKSGLPWSGMVKNRCKNGDFYWVHANVTPVIEHGIPTGYMSVRTKPNRQQIDQATQLYRDINSGNPNHITIKQGQAIKAGRWSKIAELKNISLAQRVAINLGLIALLSGILFVNAVMGGLHFFFAAGTALISILSLYFWYSMQDAIIRPLRQVTATAKVLAGGDLTSKLDATRHDDVGQLLLLIRQLNINLSSIIGDIRGNFEQIVASTNEVSAGNLNLQARTESQASSLEETSASMEELTSTVEHNSANAGEANSLAHGATGLAEKAGTAVSKVVDAMDQINGSSRKIVEIISLIDGIAFQTNILALNAAVEAARAGEQGRGFAVVASEVRNLAQRSAAAAKDIKSLIDVSAHQVEIGTSLASQAGTNMSDVLVAIKQLAGVITEISLATREQSAGIGQVKDAILQLDDVTQQNAAMVEESAASATVLSAQAFAVSNSLQVFKLTPAENRTNLIPRTIQKKSVARIEALTLSASAVI